MERARCQTIIALIALTAVGSTMLHAAPSTLWSLDPLGLSRKSAPDLPFRHPWEGEAPAEPIPGVPTNTGVMTTYGKLPLSFVENQGQLHDAVRYVIRGPQASAFFTDTDVTFDLWEAADEEAGARERAVLRVIFEEAGPTCHAEGIHELSGKVNYFIGNDSSKWHTNIPTFKGVIYRDVWPGIDIAYRGDRRWLKYDIHVSPGADLSDIRLRYEGAERIWLDNSGRLHIQTAVTTFTENVPGIHQVLGAKKVSLEGGYVLLNSETVGFHVEAHDPSLPLVIDPESDLIWSTFLGGSGGGAPPQVHDDRAYAVSVDATGCVYLTGGRNPLIFRQRAVRATAASVTTHLSRSSTPTVPL